MDISSAGDFPNIDILIDNQKLIRKLRDNGMCDAFGYPTYKSQDNLTNLLQLSVLNFFRIKFIFDSIRWTINIK